MKILLSNPCHLANGENRFSSSRSYHSRAFDFNQRAVWFGRSWHWSWWPRKKTSPRPWQAVQLLHIRCQASGCFKAQCYTVCVSRSPSIWVKGQSLAPKVAILIKVVDRKALEVLMSKRVQAWDVVSTFRSVVSCSFLIIPTLASSWLYQCSFQLLHVQKAFSIWKHPPVASRSIPSTFQDLQSFQGCQCLANCIGTS